MSTPKFKIGDVLRVVKRSSKPDDLGSDIRNNFVVESIRAIGLYPKSGPIYESVDDGRGAFEEQLEYEKIENWRERYERLSTR